MALVGYTNAGKSTLMNALTEAGVYVADKLFATLDTRTRKWHVPQLGDVLLSDTVGFIRKLPHDLVDLELRHVIENPALKAIEIVGFDSRSGKELTSRNRLRQNASLSKATS